MVKNPLIWVSGCAQPSISARAAIGTSHSSIPALVLFTLMEWGHQHVLHSAPPIALVDSASGETVHPGFVTASGSVASPSALQIVKAGTHAET
ncbi:transcriptional regulator [Klebsiella pneumoniae]|uniref:transcriptional regulator n=1 Tax=Klebsiella pneumoniae TaxID=573 RepID=UPI003887F14B|nr:transcriptional regulator [Klebsiella pneumoniae]HCJ2026383.1 transcriptional regulator [Klebsiella pneumoniae]HCJ2218369.1 transcriptional regulator [Klebsiella pneumoniae]